MRQLKVTLAYDGSNFQGWQDQKTGRTVEGEVKKALRFMHKHDVGLNAAGRTDSGVHANGQVIGFQSDLDGIDLNRFPRALNSFLPHDIRIRLVEQADDSFHARHDARERSYKYYLYTGELPVPHFRPYSHHVVHKPDLNKLNRLASVLVGEHDFSTFSVPSKDTPNHVRNVFTAAFHTEGPFIVFYIAAQSFLWRMVRCIVGSLLKYELDGIDPAEVRKYLLAQDKTLAGPTAPAWGLFLHQVRYKDEIRVH